MKIDEFKQSTLFKKVRPQYRTLCKVLADCLNESLDAPDNTQQAAGALNLVGISVATAIERLNQRNFDPDDSLEIEDFIGNTPQFRREFTLIAIQLLAEQLMHPAEGV